MAGGRTAIVDSENAEAAAKALRMVIAGLAEQTLEAVATPEPGAIADRVTSLEELADLGRDIAMAANAAAMALRHCLESRL